MQFDMSRAWREATDMLAANREVILALSGVFFFLPAFASSLMMTVSEPPVGGDEAAMSAWFLALYRANAPILVGSALIQLVGIITLLALLRDDRKPTVGQALKTGALGILPYIGSYLLLVAALFLAIVVVAGIPAALGQPGIGLALAVLAVLPMLYVAVKLSLITPVIAIEKLMNPIAILQRSWRLTSGNGLRLFLFYFLLTVVYAVISLVASGVLGVLSVLLGQGSAYEIGMGIGTGLVSAAGTAVFTVVLAAVHRQLAGPSAAGLGRTFG
ncbi:MAG: hypothetical protein P0Y56_07550 [Candidatus Andeanibacterium colombiense]|uniref:Glycerophosphoryl diester phosphodiesterase membrane domain-containing protein n=1 Tax=Candidatus Andeanibacterium colombiense TaxID=3121345 RepID=A0AAJ5X905_9SPHN|nr:MAG: hypothetical protein P0Y56_07550 [Sphingomonadaceae bacterium]